MKKALICLILLFPLTDTYSQVEKVYPFFFRVMDANQQITFLAAPILYKSLKQSRKFELTEAEGKKGFLLEPFLDLNFPIIQGKTDGRPFWNTSRFSINYGFNTRIVKTNSSPILPPTNRIGISVDKILYETVSGTNWFPWSFRSDIVPIMPFESENIQIVYFSFLLEHHSNGQNGEIFIKDPITNIPIRNNYKDGDFSTNFYRLNITYSGLFKRRTLLLTGSLGLQLETGDNNGFLAFFQEQEERYGKMRILSMLQVRLPPIRNSHEIRIRLENQLILCDCKKYLYYPKRYLNGTSLFLEYNPLKLKTLGLMLHFYRGRDYLNIRYDDPIFISHLGITIAIKKYHPLSIPELLIR